MLRGTWNKDMIQRGINPSRVTHEALQEPVRHFGLFLQGVGGMVGGVGGWVGGEA